MGGTHTFLPKDFPPRQTQHEVYRPKNADSPPEIITRPLFEIGEIAKWWQDFRQVAATDEVSLQDGSHHHVTQYGHPNFGDTERICPEAKTLGNDVSIEIWCSGIRSVCNHAGFSIPYSDRGKRFFPLQRPNDGFQYSDAEGIRHDFSPAALVGTHHVARLEVLRMIVHFVPEVIYFGFRNRIQRKGRLHASASYVSRTIMPQIEECFPTNCSAPTAFQQPLPNHA